MRKITSPELQSAISRTREFHQLCSQALVQLIATNVGTQLAFGYCNIAFEHFGSMAYLIDLGNHDSSALALFRCLVETVHKGLYVLHCITEEEEELIASNRFVFPKFECISSRIDEKFGVEKGMKMPGEVWGLMNGYTHSGFEQLILQYGEDGSIEPNHTPDQFIPILEMCALDISMIAASTCEACARRDLALHITSKRRELFPVAEA